MEDTKFQAKYDYVMAQSIGNLAAASYQQWGDPIANRKKLVPYGFAPIDKALWGIAPKEFIIVQGQEKGRKSTVLANILKNINTRKQLEKKPVIVFDILESSSGPEQVKDSILCMLASEYIMEKGHRSDGYCSVCGDEICNELQLSARSLMFLSRSALQKAALDYAISEVSTWTIYMFGSGRDEGNTRNLDASISRWKWMQQELGATMFIADHIQQYYSGRTMTDYEMQQWVVPALSTFVGETKATMIALSQLSLGTRIANKDGGRMYATGGSKAAAEANTVLQSMYDEDHPFYVGVRVVESRYSGPFTVYGKIDPTSGLIYGDMGFEPPYSEITPTKTEREDMPYGT